MPFVVFTLALVLNYHVHLIRVADELGGLDWRCQYACAKSQDKKIDPQVDRCTSSSLMRTPSDQWAKHGWLSVTARWVTLPLLRRIIMDVHNADSSVLEPGHGYVVSKIFIGTRSTRVTDYDIFRKISAVKNQVICQSKEQMLVSDTRPDACMYGSALCFFPTTYHHGRNSFRFTV